MVEKKETTKNILIHPTYFGPINNYVEIIKAESITFEVCDNFQKQTYRNRCYISSPNGRLMLNVPIKHNKVQGRKKTKDTLIDYDTEDWVKKHLKSFQNSYQSSPYFEFFEDEISELYAKKFKYLIDLNLYTHELVFNALDIHNKWKKTTEYTESVIEKNLRHLVNCKEKSKYSFESYTQMFDTKNNFLADQSILDLLFMQGQASEIYLKNCRSKD